MTTPKTLEDFKKKYPEMFNHESMLGFDLSPGWAEIIDELCDCITRFSKANNKKVPEVHQIKEKFGDLRFYTGSVWDSNIFGMIHFAEWLCGSICEGCGTKEKVTKEGKGWIRTLCPKCRMKYEKRFTP